MRAGLLYGTAACAGQQPWHTRGSAVRDNSLCGTTALACVRVCCTGQQPVRDNSLGMRAGLLYGTTALTCARVFCTGQQPWHVCGSAIAAAGVCRHLCRPGGGYSTVPYLTSVTGWCPWTHDRDSRTVQEIQQPAVACIVSSVPVCLLWCSCSCGVAGRPQQARALIPVRC
jgi:hypothetical protein